MIFLPIMMYVYRYCEINMTYGLVLKEKNSCYTGLILMYF